MNFHFNVIFGDQLTNCYKRSEYRIQIVQLGIDHYESRLSKLRLIKEEYDRSLRFLRVNIIKYDDIFIHLRDHERFYDSDAERKRNELMDLYSPIADALCETDSCILQCEKAIIEMREGIQFLKDRLQNEEQQSRKRLKDSHKSYEEQKNVSRRQEPSGSSN